MVSLVLVRRRCPECVAQDAARRSARARLRVLIEDMQSGRRCRRCAGLGPLDGDADTTCRCGSDWEAGVR